MSETTTSSPPPEARIPAALSRARFPAAVLEVLRVLDAAGHRSWIVGGAVRDLLLRRPRAQADHDLATPARPEQVMALFRKVIPTGVAHGTVTVVVQGMAVEVTTFRGEGAYVDGRRPSSVTFIDDIDADLARRDFTINALAYDPIGPAFRDPFGGRGDLRRRLLRAVGDPAQRFAEDGLRPLRAVRFVAQLGFALEPATLAAIPGLLDVTSKVSAERVTEELSRLLVARHARRALELLDRTGLLRIAWPELAALSPERRLHAFDVAARTRPELTVRLAALLHVMGRGEGGELRRSLERRRWPGRVVERVAALAAGSGCVRDLHRERFPRRGPGLRRWLAKVGRSAVAERLELEEADVRCAGSPWRVLCERLALCRFRRRLAAEELRGPPLSIAELALDGRSIMKILGVSAGPIVGEALQFLMERVLDEPSLNTRGALEAEVALWGRSRKS